MNEWNNGEMCRMDVMLPRVLLKYAGVSAQPTFWVNPNPLILANILNTYWTKPSPLSRNSMLPRAILGDGEAGAQYVP